jgi:hypothetical protein
MVQTVSNYHPYLQQAVKLLGCNQTGQYDDKSSDVNKYHTSTSKVDHTSEKKSMFQQLLELMINVQQGPMVFLKSLLNSNEQANVDNKLSSTKNAFNNDDASTMNNLKKT